MLCSADGITKLCIWIRTAKRHVHGICWSRAAVLNLEEPGATSSLSYRFEGHRIINDDNLLEVRLTSYRRDVQKYTVPNHFKKYIVLFDYTIHKNI